MKRAFSLAILFVIMMLVVVGCKKEDVSKEEQNALSQDQEKEESIAEDNQKTDIDKEDTATDDASSETSEKTTEETTENPLPINFEMSDGRGNLVNLSEYNKDKILFLNFFTTWCGYCMEEMPGFQKIYEKYSDDIEIVIVNVNHDPGEVSVDEVLKWYDESGYTFPMVIDEDGIKMEAFYPYVEGYPTTFVYDKDGSFLGYIPGALDETTMTQIIEDTLK